MCGRLTLNTPAKQLATLFDGLNFSDTKPRFNICPSQLVLGVRLNCDDVKLEPARLRWGLIPSWAKDATFATKMINARCETITKKPAFRNAFKLGATGRGRCLLLADGFYEWKTTNGHRQPFYISQQNKQPFVMAGLWESWTDPTGQLGTIESCTIMTQPASAFMQALHHRMPAILSIKAGAEWLEIDFDDRKLIDWLDVANQKVDLQTWPVSTKVNQPANDSPDLIRPVEGQGNQGLLF